MVASLRIVERDPLTLSGRAFRADEHVTVVVESGAGKAHIRKVRAGDDGCFLLAFPGLALSRSSGDLEVTATGARGSQAAFSLRRLHG